MARDVPSFRRNDRAGQRRQLFSAFTGDVTLDRNVTAVTGGMLADTLTVAAAQVVRTTGGTTDAGTTTHLRTTANDAWQISCYANTSAGWITITGCDLAAPAP